MSWQIETRYLSAVTNQPFLLPETRQIAAWLLNQTRWEAIREAVIQDNALQLGARSSRQNVLKGISSRLRGAPPALLELLAEHSLAVARLSNFYACLRQYRLLRELMAECICDNASRYVWSLTRFEAARFFEHRREQQPTLAAWSPETYRRVQSNTLRLVFEAGLLGTPSASHTGTIMGSGPWEICRPLLPPALRELMQAEGHSAWQRYFLEG